MIRIYEAAHLADAHMVRELLVREGIAAHIQGEYLQGALGEIPVSGQIGVTVAAPDAPRARAIVLDWERAVPERLTDAEEAPSGAQAAAPVRSRVSLPATFGAGLLLGAGGCWLLLVGPEQTVPADEDDDGIVETSYVHTGERLRRIEIDRNGDGTPDLVHFSDWRGRPVRDTYDDDFDGRMETRVRHRGVVWHETTTDDDGDGRIDYRAEATAGVLFRETWYDHEGREIKRIVYEGGLPVRGTFDSDGDGRPDIERRYDARGEIVAIRQLGAADRR
ncbi:putative signal transducing protein [Luteimonas suaedae]|uniref:putative signal transducing protein n=1 Tax=Luteimonas suaedae TaxID=2605430 RepID=UPI00210437D8|nr:DUF2007 domain-containing protein [Luteimonas suaedae]